MPLSNTMRELTLQAITEAQLPNDFIYQVESYYLPLAEFIDNQAKAQSKPLLISLQGPQGAGKSTLCDFLKLLLENAFGQHLAVLSLDDFYYPASKRQELARDIHPLLKTRGVPGTHDLELAANTLKSLVYGEQISLPRFNKATDDPYPQTEWPLSATQTSIILFEGWCNHVPTQSAAELEEAVNELESNEDPDGSWRNYVNNQLSSYHKQLFSLADILICLRISDFQRVYDWRGLQEEKLRAKSSKGSAVMSEAEVRRFIQHFERLTRHAMAALPERADACLAINDAHQLTAFDIKGN